MKIPKNYLLALLILASIVASYSQVVDEPYKVCTWLGNRSVAVSYTFDDDYPNQLAVAVPLFNEFGYKLTMFIFTNAGYNNPNWPALAQASSQGHEIASHTETHSNLSTLTEEQQRAEYQNSNDAILAHIPGLVGLTMAYPYCVAGKAALPPLFYIGARGCSGIVEKSTPPNLYNISSIVCGPQGSIKTANDFNTRVESAVKTSGVCVFLMHGVDNEGSWSDTPSTELRSHLEYIKANDNKFWVATFGNMIRYVRERNLASVTETSAQDTVMTIQVSDTLDNTIYNKPISIRRPLPEGWPSAVVTQNGHDVNVTITELDQVKNIIFDVVPDSGEIIITKGKSTNVRSGRNSIAESPELSQNYPNPFNPATRISFYIPKENHVLIKIINMAGQEILTLADKSFTAGDHVILWDGKDNSGKRIASGTYLYQLIADNYCNVKKMMVLQ